MNTRDQRFLDVLLKRIKIGNDPTFDDLDHAMYSLSLIDISLVRKFPEIKESVLDLLIELVGGDFGNYTIQTKAMSIYKELIMYTPQTNTVQRPEPGEYPVGGLY